MSSRPGNHADNAVNNPVSRLKPVLRGLAHGGLIFLFGLFLGGASWAISPLLSGKFEPFDAGLALWVGQAVMIAYGGYVGFRHGFWKLLLAMLGIYVGQVTYAYLFGSSETRAWILLGAFTTLFLCALPALAGLAGVVTRFIWKRRNDNG